MNNTNNCKSHLISHYNRLNLQFSRNGLIVTVSPKEDALHPKNQKNQMGTETCGLSFPTRDAPDQYIGGFDTGIEELESQATLTEKSPNSSGVLSQSKKIQKQALKNFSPSTEDDQPKEKSERKKKTDWTPALDAQVLELLAKYGTRWTDIGRMIGDQTGKQVRDRYLQKLRPNINFEKWTKDEDAQVMTLYKKFGNKWRKIAECLVNRTESQVKNRFHAKLKNLLFPNEMPKEANTKPECDLEPIAELGSLAEIEDDDNDAQNTIDLIDFDNISIDKNAFTPDLERINSTSIQKQNSAITQFGLDVAKEADEWNFYDPMRMPR